MVVPALSVITTLGIVLVLVQMGLTEDVRIQLVLSLVSFAVVLVLFFITGPGSPACPSGSRPSRPVRRAAYSSWRTRRSRPTS